MEAYLDVIRESVRSLEQERGLIANSFHPKYDNYNVKVMEIDSIKKTIDMNLEIYNKLLQKKYQSQ